MNADKKDGEEATGTCYLPVRHADRYGQKQVKVDKKIRLVENGH